MQPQAEQLTDEQIAVLVQGGDFDVFAQLVERYEPKLTRYANRFLLSNECEDLLQDVFIKAFSNIQSFDTERKFSSWIYRIAHNEFINAIRKKQRFSFPLLELDTVFPHPVAKETAERETLSNEAKERLEKALGEIDPKYREVLVLYYIEEMGYNEIADILHIPTSTVGVRLSRAKQQLKTVLT